MVNDTSTLCWANAISQVLFHTMGNGLVENTAIDNLFSQLGLSDSSTRRALEAKYIKKVIAWVNKQSTFNFNLMLQHCPNEFLAVILDLVPAWKKKCDFRLISVMRCPNCGNGTVSHSTESHLVVQLTGRELSPTVESVVNQFLESEMDVSFRCSSAHCNTQAIGGKVDADRQGCKQMTLAFVRTLFVTFNRSLVPGSKVHTKVRVEKTLFISGIGQFVVDAAWFHRGEVSTGGHVTCTVRNPSGDDCVYLDDDKAYPVPDFSTLVVGGKRVNSDDCVYGVCYRLVVPAVYRGDMYNRTAAGPSLDPPTGREKAREMTASPRNPRSQTSSSFDAPSSHPLRQDFSFTTLKTENGLCEDPKNSDMVGFPVADNGTKKTSSAVTQLQTSCEVTADEGSEDATEPQAVGNATDRTEGFHTGKRPRPPITAPSPSGTGDDSTDSVLSECTQHSALPCVVWVPPTLSSSGHDLCSDPLIGIVGGSSKSCCTHFQGQESRPLGPFDPLTRLVLGFGEGPTESEYPAVQTFDPLTRFVLGIHQASTETREQDKHTLKKSRSIMVQGFEPSDPFPHLQTSVTPKNAAATTTRTDPFPLTHSNVKADGFGETVLCDDTPTVNSMENTSMLSVSQHPKMGSEGGSFVDYDELGGGGEWPDDEGRGDVKDEAITSDQQVSLPIDPKVLKEEALLDAISDPTGVLRTFREDFLPEEWSAYTPQQREFYQRCKRSLAVAFWTESSPGKRSQKVNNVTRNFRKTIYKSHTPENRKRVKDLESLLARAKDISPIQ